MFDPAHIATGQGALGNVLAALAGPIETLISAVRAAASGIRAIVGGVDPVYAPTLGGPFSSSA